MDHSERVTVGSPDFRAVEVRGVTGKLYRARDGGMYDMHPADAAALVHEGGFAVGIGGSSATSKGGFICPNGHRNFIRTCGRCGS